MADSTAATVITNITITNPIILLSHSDIVKKLREIERSIISMEIKSKIMLVLLIIIPSILIENKIKGNTVKEYTILILILLLLIHRLNLKLKQLKIKEE